jgi:hypothetical protein
MADSTVKIIKRAQLGTAFAIIHTVYNVRNLRVTMLHLVNTTAGAVTVQVCAVPPGGSPDITNALMWNFSIPANDLIEIADGLIMEASSTLQALAGAGGSITLQFSGLED